MNTPDFAKLITDSWPLLIGALIGASITHFLIRRRPDVERVRRQLGRALDRFADIPPTQLDTAILAAAQAALRGWRCVTSILGTAFWLVAALFSAELFRALFPTLPHWLSILFCGLVAGLLAWAVLRIERRAILHRLEHLHNATGNA